MERADRILPSGPIESLEDYIAGGGGRGLQEARATTPDDVLQRLDGAGLRGRGGAGFPLSRKWRAVMANEAFEANASIVVNAAEGEPGSFKDRAILRANPYHVLEGALIGAHVVDASKVIVGCKRTEARSIDRLEHAIGEMGDAGWFGDVDVGVFAGPSEYLYGEETALLETIDGRYPFPRIAPPYRRGVEEVVKDQSDVAANSSSAAHVEMAGPDHIAPPTLASNVETFANVPGVLAYGAEWFRSFGTAESPGTIVCTVSGDTRRSGVAEVAMGTTLRELIDEVGNGVAPGRRIAAVMSGVANPLIPGDRIDVPLTYEDMRAIGTGLGCAGFIVFDDATDFTSVAAGVARFLAVESCGQCAACKRDGLAIAETLAKLCASRAEPIDLEQMRVSLGTVADGARCNLPYQQQAVVGSILELFPDQVAQHQQKTAAPTKRVPIAAIHELSEGTSMLDERQEAKQPDWTYAETDSGKWPANRLDDHRAHDRL
ncbi:MAG TPA: NADH-ubiquinone oxidoreductase-F iron-sulfur binding region domain-containing protein [Acidimicrobiia bacterium]|nr:NADH-ubiquinone oxidoreductase-F iron-sulfur binding region domain-containing protein [Acidimicrobiia bacterium]